MSRPEYMAIPTLEGTQEARWRDHTQDQLRVVLPGDGTIILATGMRRVWVELSAAQADELEEFLAMRRTSPPTLKERAAAPRERPDIPDGFWLGELTGGGNGLCHVFRKREGLDPYRLPNTAVCGAATGRGADLVSGAPTRRVCSNCKDWLDG